MTQANVDAGWFLEFKRKADCDAAAPCNIAAYNTYNNPKAPLIPCNKTAPTSVPNCAYCCNFSASGTGAYNEPIGGGTKGSNRTTRFGNNALGVRRDAFIMRSFIGFFCLHVDTEIFYFLCSKQQRSLEASSNTQAVNVCRARSKINVGVLSL